MPTNAQTRPESAIHTDLIRKIMNKELQPGQRLPEAELVGVCALRRTPTLKCRAVLILKFYCNLIFRPCQELSNTR